MTIEEAVSRAMPLKDKVACKREVLAALRTSGFQMFTESGNPTGSPETYLADRVTVGHCSGGEQPTTRSATLTLTTITTINSFFEDVFSRQGHGRQVLRRLASHSRALSRRYYIWAIHIYWSCLGGARPLQTDARLANGR